MPPESPSDSDRPAPLPERTDPPPIDGVLETCLYIRDLEAAERFYRDVLGLRMLSHVPGRHVFFRCGAGVLLLFNPEKTSTDLSSVGDAHVPLHGSHGAGHVAFRVSEASLAAWRGRLVAAGVVIESEVSWPRGGRSLYVRDPGGNSVELTTPQIWGID